MQTRSYLDHAASSPMPESVAAVVSEAMLQPGNPSSLHASGRAARRRVEEARESLAADLGAHPDEIVFTSGGTEANNLAVLGVLAGGGDVLVSAIEHPSVAEARARSARVGVIGVDDVGMVAPDLLTTDGDGPAPGLVSVMWVNNETGVVQDVPAIVEAAHRMGALAHADAVQAFGHLPTDFAASGLDLCSVSAHKLGGPVGVGALVVRRGVKLAAVGFGGGQEARLRSGTVASALIVGFAAAARLARQAQQQEAVRLAGLRSRLRDAALSLPAVIDNSAPVHSPAILNLTFTGSRADDLLLLLDAAGVDASTGSACTAGLHQPSEVLMAMGRDEAQASASLRFSFGWSTTEADVDRVVEILPTVVERARRAW